MPELPEVETVRRSLEQILSGRTISGVAVHLPRIVRTPSDAGEFCRRLEGRVVTGVRRRGKYLLVDLDGDVLVSHLRMEGRFGLRLASEPLEPHTHVVFALLGGDELRYRDVRQFGTMDLLPASDLDSLRGLRELALEPVEEGFDGAYLVQRLQGKRTPVKAALLDQTVVAGLGNIYVDEILFQARVHPERKAASLRRSEADAIAVCARDTLLEAIRLGGSSVKSYVDGFGAPGTYQYSLRVYGRADEPCCRCGAPIRKGRVGGRGTHVCVVCQKPPRGALIQAVPAGGAGRRA